MDNTAAMLRQYLSIRVQLKSVGVLIDEIERLSTEVITKIVDKAGDITVDKFLIGRPDFSSSYPDEYEGLYVIGKKAGQGMSELRSSLDYFVRFLVYANGKTPHKNSEFPVSEDEKSLNKTCLCGLIHDQKLSILDMQPAYADHPQAAMLSAVHYYRNIYMHNAVPEIEPSITRGYSGGLSREEMRKKIAAIQVKDANISLRFAVSLEYEEKIKKLMEQSELHGPPDKLLGRFKMMIIEIMRRLNELSDHGSPDFDFNLYNDSSRGILGRHG